MRALCSLSCTRAHKGFDFGGLLLLLLPELKDALLADADLIDFFNGTF